MKRILIVLSCLLLSFNISFAAKTQHHKKAAPTISKYCSAAGAVPANDTRVVVHNNCGSTVSVYMMANTLQGVPSCLKDLAHGAKGSVDLSYGGAWGYALYKSGPAGNPGCSNHSVCPKTRFEITIHPSTDPYPYSSSWDVSANDGWDIPMTVVAPQNSAGPSLLIATDKNAPAIYPAPPSSGPETCKAVQPCASNAWDNHTSGKQYDVYLCNRPTDTQNTPGKCGCSQCPGRPCDKGDPDCTTSGSGIYCKTVCNPPAECGSVSWGNPPSKCTALCPKAKKKMSLK